MAEHLDRRQHRGAREAYERYLAGMDASMRQKIALTAAHLLCVGRVADMGMGSGAGSHALAALHPSLEVVGVDLDPSMVELAREKYRLPNLTFVAGDIALPVFPEGSLDGVLDSSVLHHVTSFNGYGPHNATRAIEVQARALKPHGTLIVRDFVAPARDRGRRYRRSRWSLSPVGRAIAGGRAPAGRRGAARGPLRALGPAHERRRASRRAVRGSPQDRRPSRRARTRRARLSSEARIARAPGTRHAHEPC